MHLRIVSILVSLGTLLGAGCGGGSGSAGGPRRLRSRTTWQHVQPTAGLDIVVTGAGTVVYGPGAGDKVP